MPGISLTTTRGYGHPMPQPQRCSSLSCRQPIHNLVLDKSPFACACTLAWHGRHGNHPLELESAESPSSLSRLHWVARSCLVHPWRRPMHRDHISGTVGAKHGVRLIIAPHMVVLAQSANAQSGWDWLLLLNWMRTRRVVSLHNNGLASDCFNWPAYCAAYSHW